jgi:hypothetical protein
MRTTFLASLLLLVVGCGGDAFQSATHDVLTEAGGAIEASPPDAPSTPAVDAPSSPSDALAPDATSEAPSFVDVAPRDALPDTSTPPSVDAGELVDARNEPQACDLKPCQGKTDAGDIICNGYVALCCNGPCPPGFEGMTCYCGQCRFPTHYVPDAGTCEL